MEVEKTVQFILETQARHEVFLQQADERFARFREQTEERFRGLVDVSMSLTNNLQSLSESVRELRELHAHLTESQAHSDRRLDALIDITRELSATVDKLTRRNGSQE